MLAFAEGRLGVEGVDGGFEPETEATAPFLAEEGDLRLPFSSIAWVQTKTFP
jgi:hypothetical protein